MKRGTVSGWTGSWGEIETKDGKVIWVGYKDIADPPNEKGFNDLWVGDIVEFNLQKNKYRNPYSGEKSQWKYKAVNVRTIKKSNELNDGTQEKEKV